MKLALHRGDDSQVLSVSGLAAEGAALGAQKDEHTTLLPASAIALLAGVQFALFGYFLLRTAISSPISDMFNYIDTYLRFRGGDLSLPDYLWRAHGEHHLVWIRLLTWADVEIFHTRGFAFMLAATLAIMATAVLLWQQVRRAEHMVGATTSLALLAPMLILSTANVIDCSVPINTTYPLTMFFAVMTLVLFAAAPAAAHNAQSRRLAAMFTAVGASMGTSAGLLLWPILLWLGWLGRLSRTWLVTLAGTGTLYILFYLKGLYFLGLAPALANGADSLFSAAHVEKLAWYFVGFLGLPFTRAVVLGPTGLLFGGMLLVAGVVCVLGVAHARRASTPFDRVGIGLILLAFGSAALAAINRSDLTDEGAIPVRYTMFVSALHVGLLLVIGPRVARHLERLGRPQILQSVGLAFALGLVALQVLIGRSAAEIADTIRRDADCFVQAMPMEGVSRTVTRWPEDAGRVIVALRQQGLLTPAQASACGADPIR